MGTIKKIAVVMTLVCVGAGLAYSQSSKSKQSKNTVVTLTGNVTTQLRKAVEGKEYETEVYDLNTGKKVDAKRRKAYLEQNGNVPRVRYTCFEIKEAVSEAGTPITKLRGRCLEFAGDDGEDDVSRYKYKGENKQPCSKLQGIKN